jgi:hypothetical protein
MGRSFIPNLIPNRVRDHPLVLVSSVFSCFSFLSHGLGKVAADLSYNVQPSSVGQQGPQEGDASSSVESLSELVEILSDRVISTSGCFFGVGSV